MRPMKSSHDEYACVGREEEDLTASLNGKDNRSGNDEWLLETNREVSSETILGSDDGISGITNTDKATFIRQGY